MKMIQVRNVPDRLHATLKARAAMAGMSLSDFLISELRLLAERPSREELVERLASRVAVSPAESPTTALRAERDAR